MNCAPRIRACVRACVRGLLVAALGSLLFAGVADAQALPTPRATRTPDLAEVERIARSRPADAEVRIGYAALLLGARDTARAEAELRNALTTEGIDRLRVSLALAELLGASARYLEGEQVLRPFPADTLARRMRGRLLLVAGGRATRTDEAARLWTQAVGVDPSLADGWSGLVALAATRNDTDSAVALVTRGLRYAPTDARLLSMQASLLRTEESVGAAVAGLRAARRSAPSEENGLALAAMLRQQGDAPGLLALLDTLLQPARPGLEVFRLGAEVRRRRGERTQAIAILERAQGLHAREATLFADEADLRREAKEWRLSAQAWLRAIDRASDPTQFEFELAETYALSGDTAAAVAQLHPLAAPDRPATVLHLAAVRLRAFGDTAAAVAAWRARLAADGNDAAALVGLAESADAAGDRAAARPLWERAEPLASSGPWPALALRRGVSGEELQRWTRRALWRGLEALAGAEQRALGTLEGGASAAALARARPDLAERDRIIAALGPMLDSLAADEAWGRAEVEEAARAWRGSPVLTRAQARADVVHGRLESATARYDSLLARRPGDAALQLEVGDHYVRVGRTGDALQAFAFALEASPESEQPFRALLRADRSPAGLESLERQIVRLRMRLPRSIILADRHVEVLHRLGRTAEAARVARELETLRAERGEVPPVGVER